MKRVSQCLYVKSRNGFTVWPGNLAPDDTDLGAPDLLLAPVDESDLLAKVEAGQMVSIQADSRTPPLMKQHTWRPRCCQHPRS